MLIKSLRYKNFRQFKGENIITFSCDPEKNVTIILGDNTYGKTTLLQMFNWCFYDKAIFNDNPDFLLNLEISSAMYNGDDPVEVLVEIILIHEGKEYTINRKQDYLKVNGTVVPKESQLKITFKTIATGITGFVDKDKDMKSVINMIMPEDLSGYFFFDTERVQNVAERKDLSSSVKGLLGLTVLDNAIKHLGKEESKTTVIGSFYEELKKNDDGKAADALENIQKAEDDRIYHQKVKDDTEEENKIYERRKGVLEEKIRDLKDTTDLQKRKEHLEREVDVEQKALKKMYDEYPVFFGDDAAWFFAQPLYRQAEEFLNKAEVNDKGISDVTANTIRELIQNGRCLCGAKIENGNDAYNHLMEQIKFVPPESIGTTIKNFKKDIIQYDKINTNDKYFIHIQSMIGEIVRSKDRLNGWNEEIEEIETKIAGKEDARKYQIELNDVKNRIKNNTEKKENEIGKIAEAESKKSRFKKIYDTLSAKSDKGKEIRRYIAYAAELQKWLKDYYASEEAIIREELQKHVNVIFQRMYHGERELEINEKYQTVLYTVIPGTNERVISGESEGLIRVKNFAFIAGLVDLAKGKALKAGDNKIENEPYPLILDAPFSNADEEHIRNISKELPSVAEQVIMFVMKKDWNYAETVMLDKAGKMYKLEKYSDTYSTVK